jgi:hypothetical protein
MDVVRKSRGSVILGSIGLVVLLMGSLTPLWSLDRLGWSVFDRPASAFLMSCFLTIAGVVLGLRLHAVVALLGLGSLVSWVYWFEADERRLTATDAHHFQGEEGAPWPFGESPFDGLLAFGHSFTADWGWLVLIIGSVLLVASGVWGRLRDRRW